MGGPSFIDTFCKQSRGLVLLEAIVLALLIGYVDYVNAAFSLMIFYAIPILMVAWCGNRRLALAVAALCGTLWFLAHAESHHHRTRSAFVWSSVSRFAYFAFVAVGGTALRRHREELRARLDASQRARALEQEIVRLSEREQMRLGQDLHDGLCQSLAAIDCAAACLKRDLEAEARHEVGAVATIQDMLQAAIVEARNLARGISPVHADIEDLRAVLEELAVATNQAGALTASFSHSGSGRHPEPQISLHLYRVAQEAVRNAVKHSQGSRVEIELQQEENGLRLVIADDGQGFSGAPSKGMGLGTMRYRARLIDAHLNIANRPGGGAVVTCIWPYHDAAQD